MSDQKNNGKELEVNELAEQAHQQITAAPLSVDGVSNSDPDGNIPPDLLINGTIGRIPRWSHFPQPPAPGQPADYTILRVFWRQDGVVTTIFTDTYTYVDDRPEFTFPIAPQQMIVEGIAFLYYELEGRNGNTDPSDSERKLTIVHAGLMKPVFPDTTPLGYLNCNSPKPVWEGVNVKINPDPRFRERDECILTWQGFSNLNGTGDELTPLHEFRKIITSDEASRGFIVFIPFDPYVRPMIDDDSGVARYSMYRSGVRIGKPAGEFVKIDRIIPGSPPCGGPA